MPFRADILKGVRLAAVLFGVFLCGLTVRRMIHVAASEDRGVPPPPAASAPPAIAPAQPAAVELSMPDLPPPPPPAQIHRIVRKRTPAPAPKPVVVVVQEASADTVAPREPESAPAAAPAAETQALEVAANDIQSQDPAPSAAPETPAPRKGGGKRLIKAVGRFLHIGQKEDPAQAAR